MPQREAFGQLEQEKLLYFGRENRSFTTVYVETQCVGIHASCRGGKKILRLSAMASAGTGGPNLSLDQGCLTPRLDNPKDQPKYHVFNPDSPHTHRVRQSGQFKS